MFRFVIPNVCKELFSTSPTGLPASTHLPQGWRRWKRLPWQGCPVSQRRRWLSRSRRWPRLVNTEQGAGGKVELLSYQLPVEDWPTFRHAQPFIPVCKKSESRFKLRRHRFEKTIYYALTFYVYTHPNSQYIFGQCQS